MDADQLNAVSGSVERHQGVHGAVHLEGGNPACAVKAQIAAGRRIPRLHGAVAVDADQLDIVAGKRADQRVRAVVQVKHGHAERPVQVSPGAVRQAVRRLEGAVAVDADQLGAVVKVRRGEGVHAAVHGKGGDADGAVELPVPRVAQPAGRLHGGVLVDADQLRAAASIVRDDDRVGGAVHGKGVDAVGAVKPVKAVAAMAGHRSRREGAVVVDADHVHDVIVNRGRQGVRAAVDGDYVDVAQAAKAVAAHAVRQRSRGDQLWGGGINDGHVVRVGKRVGQGRRRGSQCKRNKGRAGGDLPASGLAHATLPPPPSLGMLRTCVRAAQPLILPRCARLWL